MPNDPVLVCYYLTPSISQNFRLSYSFTHWVPYIYPHGFVTLSNFLHFNITPAAFSLGFGFLSSLLFLSLSRLPNTHLEDDNSRDVWLSLIALKRKVASLVLGQLQVVLMFYMLQVHYLWLHAFQTRVEYHVMSLPWPILTML